MKKKAAILLLSAGFLFSCQGKTSDSSLSEDIGSSESSQSVSSSEVIVKKELTVDSIYNDLLALGKNNNFTISYSSSTLKDVYTENYVLQDNVGAYYFKAKTIYQEVDKGVYSAKKKDGKYSLSYLLEGEDDEGYSNDKPLEDFHTVNYFAYLSNPNFGASKDEMSLGDDEITLDYSSDSIGGLFSILAVMFNNLTNVSSRTVNHISIKYDDTNNIVVEFSFKDENGKLTYAKRYSKGMISNVGSTKDEEAESFLSSIGDKINSKTFTYYNTLSIRNAYLSTTTTAKIVSDDGNISEDVGTYLYDCNPNYIRIASSDSETFIHRSSSGAAYILGINPQNEVCDLTFYSQSFSLLDFGYKNFDFEGFRYDEDEKAYVYYGLEAGKSLNSITYVGLNSVKFDSIKLYVDEETDLISKIVANSTSFYVQTSLMGSKEVHYEFTIDIVDYRKIGQPSVYQINSSTNKIQNVFNKLADYENVSFKTVSTEWYEGKGSKVLQPTVTTYYTKDYVYKETATKVKEGNTYKTHKTGRGQYAVRDDDGNVIGVKEFRVKEDKTVEPRSEIMYGKTLKDYWIKLDVSPLVYDLNENVISPREGMDENLLKDYLPITHSVFEAQEGSMQNGGDYGGMTFALRKDGETITDEVESFNYTYGVSGTFEADYSGKGETIFTYGSESSPIKIDDSILEQVKSMGTFKVPTKWSESQSSDAYKALKEFYVGKKNRYGVEVDVDRDIPFLFDDDLDAGWLAHTGTIGGTPDLNLNHDVEDIINDGDINNYNARYEAILQKNADYTYTAQDEDTTFATLHYYVNGDIVISMTSKAMGGIYFYTSIPQY